MKIMKFFVYLFCYAVYPFSFLFVRNKRKLAFGSSKNAFDGNAKYLFIYCQNERKDLDSVWLSLSRKTVAEVKAKGLKAYYTLSIRGMWYALTSKYWFVNTYTSDIMFAFSGNAICVNLWHGVGLKRIEFNIDSGKLAERYQKKSFEEVFYHPEVFRKPNWVVTSTPSQTNMFAPAFRIPEDRCLEVGYPRNEILVWPEEKRLKHIEKYEPFETKELLRKIKKENYRHVFVYMPTWRDSQREIFVQGFDLDKMDDILRRQKSLLLLKPHANTYVDKSVFERYKNVILLVDAGADVYPILPYTDVLITDYSSVLYDYILMEHHDVILYLYDYEDYVRERDFYYPFDENVVGKKVECFDALCQCIEQGDYKMDEIQRNRMIEKFWGDTVNNSSSQLLMQFIIRNCQLYSNKL